MATRWAIRKCIKINPIHQHRVDEDINLQRGWGGGGGGGGQDLLIEAGHGQKNFGLN